MALGPDTSIPGLRVARELDRIMERRPSPRNDRRPARSLQDIECRDYGGCRARSGGAQQGEQRLMVGGLDDRYRI